MGKRVAVTGSSGLIGGALCRHLTDRGDTVMRIVRRAPQGLDEIRWDPSRGELDPSALERLDAVVNLAGVGIGDKRWNAEHKREVERSRTDATGTVAQALVDVATQSGSRVRLVNASAVGFYGDRGDEILTEQSPPGQDFLAGVVTRWEEATQPAIDAGLSVAWARTGLVMSPEGGAFAPLLLLGKLGLGGPMGTGREWWPWITIVDEVAALTHLIDRDDIVGPVNLVAPTPARQKDIARELGRALHRPAFVPAPSFALRLVIGEFADSIVASQRLEPRVLTETGFGFAHADLTSAVRWLVHSRQ
jgi:uncharacterized protein (TIGR01777 family)